LIQGDTLEGIYAPESTGDLIFDRELVQFSTRRLAKLMALRSDLQASLARVEEQSPNRGHDWAPRYRELIKSIDLALVQLITDVTTFAVAERFTPEAKSDAGALLAEHVPHLAPMRSTDAQERLRETIHRAAGTPGAAPPLKALSGGW